MRCWLTLLLCLAMPAWAQVSVVQPWSRATPPGAKIGVGFMRLKNAGAAAERVIAVSSPVAGRVEMHVTMREGDVMKMRQVESFEVPPGATLELKPGGAHLMLVDLKRPLAKGERVPLTLRLAKGGEVTVELTVEALGARSPAHPGGH